MSTASDSSKQLSELEQSTQNKPVQNSLQVPLALHKVIIVSKTI